MPSIRAQLKKNFLSFTAPFDIELPEFAVLTGPNGGGKSQLLQMLFEGLREPLHGSAPGVELSVPGGYYKRGEVVFQDGAWPISNVGSHAGRIKDLQNLTLDWLNHGSSRHASGDDEYDNRARAQYLRTRPMALPEREWRRDHLPEDFVLRHRYGPHQVFEDLCHAFMVHHLRTFERCGIEGVRYAEVQGGSEPPWEVLNSFIRTAGLGLRCVSPALSVTDDYYVKFENEYGDHLWPANLSSGEKTIVGLGAWLLVVHRFGLHPKLVLLDEADAHLHPALLEGFCRALHEELHQKHGIAVILATHRTESLLSVPDSAIYDVTRSSPRVQQSPGRRESLLLLTEGRFTTGVPRRCVLVESHDDAAFYALATRLISDGGAPAGIVPTFLSVERGKGGAAEGGGRPKVEAWVKALRESELDEFVYGVVDHDFAPPDGRGVVAVPRHSIENYLLDPLVVYALLLDRSENPSVPGLALRKGLEGSLLQYSPSVLQAAADAVLVRVEASVDGRDAFPGRVTISYRGGVSIVVPRWLLLCRGHDLIQSFQKAYGPRLAAAFGSKPLREAFEKVGAIPDDLYVTLRSLHTGSADDVRRWRARFEGTE